mmetsp:Transcript_3826/g.7321  ORF Transcript_3826/g.7321 Transcript_3826/m.7321 type:complete len:483 (-) Transcript_3826:1821-3269(-)|eukprot:CAMPEP_0184683926 /NCGR_PEP_ID=MMETSP0312-20130426/13200_1 /TAXON_ID=31354 /ORGANISM="Compsopogon coeruleus, Strain SAG 36.94" /LENGTH=482 /DNA_ID=CAMNT_0027136653 /DNA_START=131 /DNA_END=1579 /DNA_ORIENTATION=-
MMKSLDVVVRCVAVRQTVRRPLRFVQSAAIVDSGEVDEASEAVVAEREGQAVAQDRRHRHSGFVDSQSRVDSSWVDLAEFVFSDPQEVRRGRDATIQSRFPERPSSDTEFRRGPPQPISPALDTEPGSWKEAMRVRKGSFSSIVLDGVEDLKQASQRHRQDLHEADVPRGNSRDHLDQPRNRSFSPRRDEKLSSVRDSSWKSPSVPANSTRGSGAPAVGATAEVAKFGRISSKVTGDAIRPDFCDGEESSVFENGLMQRLERATVSRHEPSPSQAAPGLDDPVDEKTGIRDLVLDHLPQKNNEARVGKGEKSFQLSDYVLSRPHTGGGSLAVNQKFQNDGQRSPERRTNNTSPSKLSGALSPLLRNSTARSARSSRFRKRTNFSKHDLIELPQVCVTQQPATAKGIQYVDVKTFLRQVPVEHWAFRHLSMAASQLDSLPSLSLSTKQNIISLVVQQLGLCAEAGNAKLSVSKINSSPAADPG